MKGEDIADRLLDLAVACLNMAAEIDGSAVGKHIARHVTRSCTSGGANYEEARSAEGSADFVHRIGVSGKEVSETVYWLKVTSRAGMVTTLDLAKWIDEGEQLVRILGASARTARNKGVALVGRERSTKPEEQTTGNRGPGTGQPMIRPGSPAGRPNDRSAGPVAC